MSRAADFPTDHPAARWLVSIRWCLLAAGLAAELLGLTLRFNSPNAISGDLWWLQLASRAPTLIRIAIAFSGALFVLLAPRLQAIVEDAWQSAANHPWWPWLLLHLLAFVALYLAIAATFGDAATGGQLSGGRLAVCAGLGIVTAFFWLLALAPLHYWHAFLVRERLALAAAVAAGTTAWLATKLAELYWRPLATGTLFLAEHLLQLFYSDVESAPSQLVFGTSTFAVRVLPQCSGYEGIGLVTVFLALYLWLFRARIRFPQAFLLFPIGAVAIWLANALRIALLVAIGTSYSPELALGGFHSQAGWMSFAGLALGFVFITHRLRFFASLGPELLAEKINPVAAALLVPFLVLMASMMLTAAFSRGFDLLYPLRVLATGAALLWFHRVYMQWDWSWSWPSVGIGGAVFMVWMLLERFTPSDNWMLGASLAALSETAAVVWISFRVIGSVLIVPIVEEMAFRGYLLRRLVAADFERTEATQFTWMSFLLSSAAFGLLHGRWLAGMLAGAAYAYAVYRRGRLGDAVIAHMTTNGLIALCVLITATWSLWS
jgi:exosortase E/protease (VPEID-CTERM system)